MSSTWKNQLYFGDNLDILKQLYADNPHGFIDLIYIDPPFNSKRNYNVLFESVDLKDTTAQKEAFADTWSNISYLATMHQISELDINLYNFLNNLDNTNVSKSAISYLVTMSIRLWYMHRLLKNSGSFYLHCDPTMSHYLKIVCDLLFGEKYFHNEIVWKRTTAHNDTARFGNNIDIILYYSKSKKKVWNPQFQEYRENYIERFKNKDADGRLWMDDNLTAKGLSGGGYEYEYKGAKSLWRVPIESMERLDKEGRLHFTRNGGIRLKRYLDEAKGLSLQTLWDDILAINSQSAERLGYPTQKPEALLERIVRASSNEGDLVADFFCGCGTSISVAQKLNRKWLGVDISHLAIKLIAKRLCDSYGDEIKKTFERHGFPKDIDSARELANNIKGGRLEFEEWIIEVLLHGVINERRNEMGFDGYRTFSIGEKKYIVMIEVKSGGTNPAKLNHFIKTVEDKKGAIGVFICFEEEITKNMRIIAAKAGSFIDDFGFTYCDKIQILSVQDLLEDKYPKIPQSRYETFKKAEKKITDADTQKQINF